MIGWPSAIGQTPAHDKLTARIARFESEAKVLASLNHPNVVSIRGFKESSGAGTPRLAVFWRPARALVTELVKRSTLTARIAQGPVILSGAKDPESVEATWPRRQPVCAPNLCFRATQTDFAFPAPLRCVNLEFVRRCPSEPEPRFP